MSIPPLWPPQQRGIELAVQAAREGCRSLAVTLPTGGGKTRIFCEIANRAVEKGKRVGIFTNRRLLTSQSSDALRDHGLDHGVMAAGYDVTLSADVQVLSVQTMGARVFKQERWHLPEFDIVIMDEAHANKAKVASRILRHYQQQGAMVFGFTATPVGIGQLYERLIVAGKNSDLRRCGALVPCDIFAPDEPDMKGVPMKAGEYVLEQAAKRSMETIVFGNVFDHWRERCPFNVPTILWAPGVNESRWFAQEFRSKGVSAVHIDGQTPDAERQSHFAASKNGELTVICSCGVLREGVNLPWISTGILIQPCGALSTYLQIVGRLLRAFPGKTRATLIDHAGAWHRHGSPNADREWELDSSDVAIHKQQKADWQDGEPQPIRCPKCSGIRSSGPKCPFCGHQHVKSIRMVRQTGGKLIRMVGDAVKRKRKVTAEQRAWDSCLYAASASGRTIAQAAGHYHSQMGDWPPVTLEHLPAHSSTDWQRKAADVFPWLARRRKAHAQQG